MNRFKIVVLVIFVVFYSWQCIDPPLGPMLPTWDVDVSLPLGKQHYSMKKLVEKNPDLINVDENDILIYSFSDTLQNSPLGSVLRLKPEPAEFALDIGALTLSPPDINFNVAVGEYVGLQAGYVGSSPGFAPVTLTGEIPSVETINYMIVDSGRISITLLNKSGVPVELPDGLAVINSDDGAVVGHLTFDGVIDPDDSADAAVALEKSRVYHKLEYEFIFSSPAEDTVVIPDESKLQLSIRFNDLYVSEADAQISNQTPESYYDGAIVIDDSTYISEALFSEGVMELIIENMADIDIPVIITFPELRSRNNLSNHYSRTFTLSRGSAHNFSIDMHDWMIHGNELKNSLNYTVQFGAITAMDDYSTFRSTDMIRGELRTKNSPHGVFVVEWIDGIIAPTQYDVALQFDLQIGEIADIFEGEVQFDNAQLHLGLFMSGGFNAFANLYIVGKNKHGVRDSLIIPADQRRIAANDWSTINFSKLNSRINDFLNTFSPHFPDELSITSHLVVNRDYESGNIDVNDALTVSVQMDVPFQFGIRNGVVRDTLSVGNSDDDLDRELFDYFNYGLMYFETENGMPVEMDLRINLLDSNGIVMHQLPLSDEPPVGIKAAPVNSAGYATGTTGRDVRVLELSREDIHILRETEMTELLLYLNSSDDDRTVVFRSQDSVQVNIFATFNVKPDFN